MKIEILKPSGYCSGVSNAINIALGCKKNSPNKKVVILGMLVHNEQTLIYLKNKGIETLYDENKSLLDLIDLLNGDEVVILTAHGHSKEIEDKLNKRNISFVDATCPFVKNTISLIKNLIDENKQIIFVGKRNHPEANAILSISQKIFLYVINKQNDLSNFKNKKVIIISQSTFSELEIKNEIEKINNNCKESTYLGGICNSSSLRQNALINLKDKIDLIYIVGSKKSNNTNTLYLIAKKHHPNAKVLFIENLDDVKNIDLENVTNIAISSGASTPQTLIDEIEEKIKKLTN